MRIFTYSVFGKILWMSICNWNLAWSQKDCDTHKFFYFGWATQKGLCIKDTFDYCKEKNGTLSTFKSVEEIEILRNDSKILLEKACQDGNYDHN